MRVLENPGRFVQVADEVGWVQAERVSPVEVQITAADPAVMAITSLGEDAGRALLRGLAALYGCVVEEVGL